MRHKNLEVSSNPLPLALLAMPVYRYGLASRKRALSALNEDRVRGSSLQWCRDQDKSFGTYYLESDIVWI